MYSDPKNDSNTVRFMPGNPNSRFPNSRAPYVRWDANGKPLDVNGGVLATARTPAAHIPLEEFRFSLNAYGSTSG